MNNKPIPASVDFTRVRHQVSGNIVISVSGNTERFICISLDDPDFLKIQTCKEYEDSSKNIQKQVIDTAYIPKTEVFTITSLIQEWMKQYD